MQLKRKISRLVLVVFLFNTLFQSQFGFNSVFASKTKESIEESVNESNKDIQENQDRQGSKENQEEQKNYEEKIKLKRKEKTKERTKWTKTFDNGDGTETVEIYSSPVHFNDKNNWKDINFNLKKSSKGYVVEDSEFKTSFSDRNIKTSLYSVELDGNTLSYTAVDGAGFGENYYNSLREVTPSTDENQILYEGIFDKVDIRNTIVGDGIKEDIIINEFTDKNAFAFKLNVKGLNFKKQKDGSIIFYKGKKEDDIVFTIPKPYMVDSKINEESGESSRSEDVSYELIEKDKETYLCVIADKEWLASPERQYPIYIDPSTTTTVSSDAYVSSKYPTNNYEADWNATDGYYQLKVGYYDSTTGTNDSYMKFYTSAINGKIINSAKLNMLCAHSYLTTANGVWIDTVNSAWDGKTLTWNNKPASTTYISTTAVRGQWIAADVTSAVSKWASSPPKSPNNGFRLHANGNGQAWWKKFRSSGNANANPYLSVTYTDVSIPTGTMYAYNNTMKEGYANISWAPVTGATSYKVGLYNGKEYEWFDAGSATSWSTKGKGIWPTESEVASGKYKLHFDGKGAELSSEPNKVYDNAGGQYAGHNIKHYAFRLKAINSIGETIESDAYTGAIPKTVPNTPWGEAIANFTPENTGFIDVAWENVVGATGYKVGIFNGKDYEWFDAGNSNSWSTKDKGIWPTESEIASGGYKLHFDGKGAELPVDPSKSYDNSGGAYAGQNIKIYAIRIMSYNSNGESEVSRAIVPSIPLVRQNFLGLEDYYGTRDVGIGKINASNQNLFLSEKDLSIESRGFDLELERNYNSLDTEVYTLGSKWKFSFERKVEEQADERVVYLDEDGTKHEFVKTANGYEAPKGVFLSLSKSLFGKYTIETRDKWKYKFNSSGKLEDIEDPNGNNSQITYDSEGRISSLVDAASRSIKFTYETDKVIATDPSGRKIVYTITNNNLSKIEHISSSGSIEKTSNIQINVDATEPTKETMILTDPQGRVEEYRLTNKKLTSYKKNISASKLQGNDIVTPSGGVDLITTFNNVQDQRMLEVTTAPKNILERYYYNNNSTLLKSIDYNGDNNQEEVVTHYKYDENRQLIKETDPNGNVTTNTYDSDARLISKEHPGAKNPSGAVKTLVEEYVYEDSNNKYLHTKLTKKEKGTSNTQTTDLTYDFKGNILEETVNKGRSDEKKTFNTYNGVGNLTQTKIENKEPNFNKVNNQITSYGYDSKNLYKLSETNADNKVTKIEYDSDTGYLTRKEEPNGTISTFEYKAFGELSKETVDYLDPLTSTRKTQTATYTYDKVGNKIEEKDKKGKITKYTYDQNNKPVTTTEPSVTIRDYGNYVNGALEGASQDVLSPVKTSYYDELGNLIAERDSKGNLLKNTYDKLDRNISVVDAANNATEYILDKNGNKLKDISKSNGTITSTTYFKYDEMNRVIGESNPADNTEEYTTLHYYDAFENELETHSITEDGVDKVINEYDGQNRVVKTTDTSGTVIDYGYDSVGNKAFEKVGGETSVSKYWYDALNRLATVEDSQKNITNYTYYDTTNEKVTDKFDGSRIVEILDGIDNTVKKTYKTPTGQTVKEEAFYYDDESNITKEFVKEIEGNKTQETNYTYDELGRKITEVSTINSNAEKKIERKYKYDNNDNIVSTWFEDYSDEANPVKSRTNTSFDSVDRETGETTSKTQVANKAGKSVSTMTSEGNSTTFNDQQNKMVVQNEAGSVSVESDSGDRVKKITSLGFNLNFNYHLNDLPKSTEMQVENSGTYKTVNTYTATYNDEKVTGISVVKDPNKENVLNIGYTYNDSGKITSANSTIGQGTNRRTKNYVYTYDTNGQLATFKEDLKNPVAYTYDKNGNLKTITNTSASSTLELTYGKEDRLENKKDVVNGQETITNYKYSSSNGNLTKISTTGKEIDLEYNAENNLITYKKTTGSNIIPIKYRYGVNGDREYKEIANKQYTYSYDLGKVIKEEIKEPNKDDIILSYINDGSGTMLGVKFEQGSTNKKYYYQANVKGDIVALTDESGNVVGEYSYDPWGNVETVYDNTTEKILDLNPYRYVGKYGVYYDKDTNLYKMGFRDYDPESTRYIIPDTAEGNEEEPLSLNKYLYAEGDPINFIDPDGHWIVPLFFGIMNAVQLAEDVISFAKKPSLKGAALIGSNFLPGSSGVRKGYKAVKLAKGLAKGAKKAVSSAKNTRIAKKISQTIKKKSTKATCFVAGTLISTENGYINIEDIKVGDSVYSKNEQTGEKGLKKVVNTFIHDKDEIIELKVNDEIIKTTEEHPFYVEGKGFVDAEYLNEGDILVDYYGKVQRLESKKVIKLDKPIKVYNFEVEDWHTYFVAKSEVFVHNKAMSAHGNSKRSNKVQHGYEIYEKKSKKVVKTGISGGKLNKNGTSRRANSQVSKWNKIEKKDMYKARVVKKNIPNRAKALKWEQENVNKLDRSGHPLNKHKLPRPER